MRHVWLLLCGILISASGFAVGQSPNPDQFYKLGPDSLVQENVPQGTVNGPHTIKSEAYPGTQHTYWVYVPAQYEKEKPAALMIFQDGHAFMREDGDVRATNVLNNLIYRRELPVMIAVFINPGRKPEQPEASAREWGDRTTNRPQEYNALDDKYARVICDELLPELKKTYNLSDDPEMRGIGGASSGAIAAFTVAWEKPDQFRKVLSLIGSFTNIRGGHKYADIVKDAEKKPIRVFFQDGRNDNRGQRRGGAYDETWDWFKQNVRLHAAMKEKGYDVNNVWGIGQHNQKHGGAIFPDMMRWLWRDAPVSTDVNDKVERAFNRPPSTVAPDDQKPSEPKTTDSGDVKAVLSKSLVFHAPFDETVDATLAAGDKRMWTAEDFEQKNPKPGNSREDVKIKAGAGKYGGSLTFGTNAPQAVLYRGGKNMGYKKEDWSGTVSIWLKLTPETDLKPGFADPIQITDKKWDDSALFVDFSKDELPRHFRLGVFPDYKTWNPKGTNWDNIAVKDRPMIVVEKPPFKNDRWTHVAFTFSHFNTDRTDAAATLYLDGKPQGARMGPQKFTWDEEKVGLILGLLYIGEMDDFAVFDKALSAEEMEGLFKLEKGISELHPK
jgi:enterochelin esterase-like enzyme